MKDEKIYSFFIDTIICSSSLCPKHRSEEVRAYGKRPDCDIGFEEGCRREYWQIDKGALGRVRSRVLWDFTNENATQIHVCTWQPDKISGKPLPKDEVFSLCDFDI